MAEFKTRKSDAYLCTLKNGDEADKELLNLIRAAVAKINKSGQGNPRRVVLRGRKPHKKAYVRNIYTGKTSYLSYTYGGSIVGGLQNAKEVDVYIYDIK